MKNNLIEKIFIQYLEKNKYRKTKERFIVLETALKMHTHFNADELYKMIKMKANKVSRATVYNTLELMSKCNILSKQNFKNDRARYEKKYGRHNHFHIICSDKGNIIEVENTKIENIVQKICRTRNLKLLEYTLQVYAVCAKDRLVK